MQKSQPRTARPYKRISDAVKTFLVGSIASIAPAEFIPSPYKNWVIFGLGLVVLGLQATDRALGYRERQKAPHA